MKLGIGARILVMALCAAFLLGGTCVKPPSPEQQRQLALQLCEAARASTGGKVSPECAALLSEPENCGSVRLTTLAAEGWLFDA